MMRVLCCRWSRRRAQSRPSHRRLSRPSPASRACSWARRTAASAAPAAPLRLLAAQTATQVGCLASHTALQVGMQATDADACAGAAKYGPDLLSWLPWRRQDDAEREGVRLSAQPQPKATAGAPVDVPMEDLAAEVQARRSHSCGLPVQWRTRLAYRRAPHGRARPGGQCSAAGPAHGVRSLRWLSAGSACRRRCS